MYHRPFLDQVQSPTRKLTLHQRLSVNADCGFELTISSVKAWRRMIVEEHPNQYPVERADSIPARLILPPQ
jgi:hypothetical protein